MVGISGGICGGKGVNKEGGISGGKVVSRKRRKNTGPVIKDLLLFIK